MRLKFLTTDLRLYHLPAKAKLSAMARDPKSWVDFRDCADSLVRTGLPVAQSNPRRAWGVPPRLWRAKCHHLPPASRGQRRGCNGWSAVSGSGLCCAAPCRRFATGTALRVIFTTLRQQGEIWDLFGHMQQHSGFDARRLNPSALAGPNHLAPSPNLKAFLWF
jgi:hypothetical protein